ncbi:hypothetical protein [Pseudaminobacter soli (ex Li et al. 2025)]|uniref:Uncharacterized protein n=1 Tax=Pseudaminobacter soli (ex Li et al. 2025) TaxID=1295366 RepID=A0A2P7RPT7_9HYPH|nr:hypothetical protein [Mesorhizobium soli]PSJ52223.1 hypothetical protein C7I85_28990 [Mesorhizobium soli]
MAANVAELKSRLVEITAKMLQLRTEIAALEGQKAAFETVVRSYDPEFASTDIKLGKRQPKGLDPSRVRVTELLTGKNSRHVVLGILRRAGRMSSLEIAQQFLAAERPDGCRIAWEPQPHKSARARWPDLCKARRVGGCENRACSP